LIALINQRLNEAQKISDYWQKSTTGVFIDEELNRKAAP
jgi:hypothetical protein